MTPAPNEPNTLDSPLLTHLQNLDEVWKETLREPEPKNALRNLAAFLKTRQAEGATIFPRYPFRALSYAEPDSVRVVILGQDPYHGPGQAQGLCFSVPDDFPAPPSLQNIFKELALEYPDPDDAAAGRPQRGAVRPPGNMGHDLTAWAEQGVLLLNTVLTVEAGQPASHAKQGWEIVTDALIQRVALSPQPKVFMLWGSHAQAKRQLLPPDGKHLVLLANHPSPLSALRPPRPFIGCNHFRLANEWLASQGASTIDWTGTGCDEAAGGG
ncbi:uracil-DNA glycosylase [Candidimonas humi]|uniref:Uracil-DNA glycosylase n=1 Tax=Candidimonas humi TaxID=683355 RepID=A0ABV8P2R5_9BURK|nr:uracil-DNA glycosylase [Candidimonas humi]